MQTLWAAHQGAVQRGSGEGGLTLLVRVLEGEGRRGAILPRLGAEVVVEARASRHRLGVEVSREGAVLQQRARESVTLPTVDKGCMLSESRTTSQLLSTNRCDGENNLRTHTILRLHESQPTTRRVLPMRR